MVADGKFDAPAAFAPYIRGSINKNKVHRVSFAVGFCKVFLLFRAINSVYKIVDRLG